MIRSLRMHADSRSERPKRENEVKLQTTGPRHYRKVTVLHKHGLKHQQAGIMRHSNSSLAPPIGTASKIHHMQHFHRGGSNAEHLLSLMAR